MEVVYKDLDGVQHDLELFETYDDGETLYIIYRNGQLFLELERDEDLRWMERYTGGSERALEYGNLVDLYYPLQLNLPGDL